MTKVKKAFEDSDIRFFTTNYSARPVILDDSGIEADEDGRKVVYAGTFLGGGVLENSNVPAVKIGTGGRKAALTTSFSSVNSNLIFVASMLGKEGNDLKIALIKPSSNNAVLSVSVASSTISIQLATDSAGAIVSTASQVMNAVNQNTNSNSLVNVNLVAGSDGSGIVSALTATALDGGVDGVSTTAEGVLFHSVDVTDGPETGTMMISGFVNLDRIPNEPTDEIKEALKGIQFLRK